MEYTPNARAHLRMDVMILMQHKKLTTKEYEAIAQGAHNLVDKDLSIQSFTLQPFMEDTEKEEETKTIDPFIINSLIDINLKLNLILTMLTSKRGPSIFTQKPIEVNLSEGGIGFTTNDKIERGDILELKILLPVFPIALIRTWGEVVRSTPLSGSSKRIGVKYINIKEEDQDKIVHYLFKRERERLRNKNT